MFQRCPTLWKSMLKMTTTLSNVVQINVEMGKLDSTLFNVLKFQCWCTQRCFNVHLTLRDVVTSYQPKNNVETTLKCLLGSFLNFQSLIYFWANFGCKSLRCLFPLKIGTHTHIHTHAHSHTYTVFRRCWFLLRY